MIVFARKALVARQWCFKYFLSPKAGNLVKKSETLLGEFVGSLDLTGRTGYFSQRVSRLQIPALQCSQGEESSLQKMCKQATPSFYNCTFQLADCFQHGTVVFAIIPVAQRSTAVSHKNLSIGLAFRQFAAIAL